MTWPRSFLGSVPGSPRTSVLGSLERPPLLHLVWASSLAYSSPSLHTPSWHTGLSSELWSHWEGCQAHIAPDPSPSLRFLPHVRRRPSCFPGLKSIPSDPTDAWAQLFQQWAHSLCPTLLPSHLPQSWLQQALLLHKYHRRPPGSPLTQEGMWCVHFPYSYIWYQKFNIPLQFVSSA